MTKINSIFALLLIIYPAYTFVISPYDSVLKRSQSSIIKMGPDDHVLASRIQEISHQLNLIESLIKNSRNSVLSNANVATIPLSAEKKLTKEKPLVCASFEQPTKEFINSASLCHLEAVPYWNQESIPINIFKPKDPYIGKIVDVKRLTGPESPGEVCHITIDHGGNLPYWEGQSLNVIPPGVDSNGKPHKVRLYSIASTRYGDNGSGQTVTLCVRRALYIDPTTGKSDPSKAGVCSTFLCEAKPGMDISIAGPSGKVMLLPEHEPHTDIIMVGTGTGVAPYRGFIRRLFQEDTPASRAYTGSAWLFLGVANRDAALYHNDWMSVVRRFPFNFRYDLALSREQKNKKGGKLYIQDKMEEYADELFNKLDNGAHIYFCGLKGMMPGIVDMLGRVADSKGISWDNKLSELKKKGQWHVEVY